MENLVYSVTIGGDEEQWLIQKYFYLTQGITVKYAGFTSSNDDLLSMFSWFFPIQSKIFSEPIEIFRKNDW